MKDLAHVKNVDLDRKRPRRKTKVAINRDIALGATLIDLDLINVNVLKIERNETTIEAENEIVIVLGSTGNSKITITETIAPISSTTRLLSRLKFRHKFSCRSTLEMAVGLEEEDSVQNHLENIINEIKTITMENFGMLSHGSRGSITHLMFRHRLSQTQRK